MGLLGLLGLVLIIFGVWQLIVAHAILIGVVLIIVGLFLASNGGDRLRL